MTGKFTCSKCGAAVSDAHAACTRCLLETGLTATESGQLGPGFLDDLPIPGDAMVIADNYRVLQTLGRGGMGVVYKAWQDNLERVVAVKTISAGAHASETERERFQREARVVAKLCHPGIVAIYDWGVDRGVPFFSMEYVEGKDLSRTLHDGLFAPERAARLIRELAGTIQYAHDQGVLHRDLKPSNVLIDLNGHPKITDFGLAKSTGGGKSLTLSGQLLGSVEYMPPEQIDAKAGGMGAWSDVYGLGAMLYQTLTGRPPFTGDTLPEILHHALATKPTPPRHLNSAVPQVLEAICLKCLEKDPQRRYATARELADDLDRFLIGEPTQVRHASRRSRVVTGLFIVLAISSLGFWLYRQRENALPQPTVQVPAQPDQALIERSDSEIPAIEPLEAEPTEPADPQFAPLEIAPTPSAPEPPAAAMLPRRHEPWTNHLGMSFRPIPGLDVLFATWETRVSDYRAFVQATDRTNDARWRVPGFAQTEEHPVVNVRWIDACAFCEWLTRVERASENLGTDQFYRLPNDLEWSMAAGLDSETNLTPQLRSGRIRRLYPWDGDWPPPPQAGNLAGVEYNRDMPVPSPFIIGYKDDHPRTAPVGSFAANTNGLHDLAGNVWEWCLDTYETGDLFHPDGVENRESMKKVLRGGAWDTVERKEILTSFRNYLGLGYRRPNVGFRCVLVVPPEEP